LQDELARLVRQGDWAALASRVPDELVDALAVCGTPFECAERIRAKVGDVADRAALFTPVAPADDELGELLGSLRA
jgi:alkanesulfonate monooxygenase SsuD/methylene tetrahydromethanopterin reductase-like flavin-dependent oxidoreductase (luciferase family)